MIKKIGAITITVMLGWAGYVYAPDKQGLVIHHQGPMVSKERVDTFNEAKAFNVGICNYTSEKFSEYGGGCSYKFLVCGDWIFQNQQENIKSIHVRGYNTVSDGIMVVYTDDESFNKRTAYTARTLIIEIDKINDYDFCLYHSDLDPSRRTDPGVFRPWFDAMGCRWDGRSFPRRIEKSLPEPRYHKWVRI